MCFRYLVSWRGSGDCDHCSLLHGCKPNQREQGRCEQRIGAPTSRLATRTERGAKIQLAFNLETYGHVAQSSRNSTTLWPFHHLPQTLVEAHWEQARARPWLPLALAIPKTYRKMFIDEANSPAPEWVQDYLQGYCFTDRSAGSVPLPVPATLRDQTATLSDRQPMAFQCLVMGAVGGAYEVAIVHRLMKYMDLTGKVESGFHDRVLGLLGDIRPHQFPTVEVANSHSVSPGGHACARTNNSGNADVTPQLDRHEHRSGTVR